MICFKSILALNRLPKIILKHLFEYYKSCLGRKLFTISKKKKKERKKNSKFLKFSDWFLHVV